MAQRKLSADQVVARLRPKLNRVSGARLFLQAVQDLRIGGRQSAAEYQYTLTSDDTASLYTWTPKLLEELGKDHAQLVDVNSDMQQNGLQTYVNIQRATAQRYGFAPNQIDSVLYDAYGQRTVTTIFNPFNQYYVVMEVAPPYWQFPQMLDRTYLSTAAGNASGSAQTQMQGRHGERRFGLLGRLGSVLVFCIQQLAQRQRAGQRGDQQHRQQPRRQLHRERRQHGSRDHGAAAHHDHVHE